jgi:co-chaperonin GroES (HSP10)
MSSVPITPLRDYIVAVKQKKNELKTKSGILLAASVNDEDSSMTVVAVGNLVREVKVKDQIIVKSYSDTQVKLEFGGDQYHLIREEDVIARVK